MTKTAVVYCKCRKCHKKYDEAKATADFMGYCSQACFHRAAKEAGYRPPKNNGSALALTRHQSEYEVLNRIGGIGSVRWSEAAR